jgi:hypothetical protein
MKLAKKISIYDGGVSNTSHVVVCEESLNFIVSHVLFHVRTNRWVMKMYVRVDC